MKKILFYSLMTLILVPTIAQAALESYILLEPLPCVPNTKSANDTTCATLGVTNMPLEDYIDYVFKFSIALAAFLAVIVIIWGGFEYMTTESFSGKGNAKKRIQGALTGLLMVLASYLILRTIDPRLVEINTSIPKIVIDTSDVRSFNDAIRADLKAMTLVDINEVNKLNKETIEIEEQIKKLEAKGINLTSEEYLALEKLKQNFTDKKNATSKRVAVGTVSAQIDIILNPMNAESSQHALDLISKNYEAAIGALDPNKSADQILELRKQLDMITNFSNQNKGVQISTYLYKNNNINNIGNTNKSRVRLMEFLVEMNSEAKKISNDSRVDPIFKEKYLKMIESRRKLIKEALNTAPNP